MNLPEWFILARCPDYADSSPRYKIYQEILPGIDYQDSASNMAGVSDTLNSTTGRNEIRPTAVNNPSITGDPPSNLLIAGGHHLSNGGGFGRKRKTAPRNKITCPNGLPQETPNAIAFSLLSSMDFQ